MVNGPDQERLVLVGQYPKTMVAVVLRLMT